MLRIYRAAPSKNSASIDARNYYRWPLRAPYYYYHKYYFTPMLTISLAGAEACRALDYFRRPNALRLTTQQGPQLLMRLSSHVEMISWIEHLQAGKLNDFIFFKVQNIHISRFQPSIYHLI